MKFSVEPSVERSVSAECARQLTDRSKELNAPQLDIEAQVAEIETGFGNQAPLADLLEDALASGRLTGLSENVLETIVNWDEDDRLRVLCLQALQQLQPQKAESLAQRLLRERSPLLDIHLLLVALETLLQQGSLSEELLQNLLQDPSVAEIVLAYLAHRSPARATQLLAEQRDLPIAPEAKQLIKQLLENPSA